MLGRRDACPGCCAAAALQASPGCNAPGCCVCARLLPPCRQPQDEMMEVPLFMEEDMVLPMEEDMVSAQGGRHGGCALRRGWDC
jgi:hypothetical protein